MPKRILMVGDNHGVDQELMTVLASINAELDVVQNPVAAYPKLWKGGYDLVVSEVKPEAARQEEALKVLWQARRACSRCEIIIITDFCGSELARHAQELGAAFCLKREDAADLLEKALLSLGFELKPRGSAEPGALAFGQERASAADGM